MSIEADTDAEPLGWQRQIYGLLRRQDVTQFAYVPDTGHQVRIDCSLADPEVYSVALTTEEEGVARNREPPRKLRDFWGYLEAKATLTTRPGIPGHEAKRA